MVNRACSRLNRPLIVGRNLLLIAAIFLGGCGSGGTGGGSSGDSLPVPEGFPQPKIPADNPYSAAKAELGRRLFYDKRLSLNQTQSCSSCHLQALSFSDGLTKSVGSTGQQHPRNAPSLVNVAYNVTFTWFNPLVDSLETQLLVPLFNGNPIELGFSGNEDELIARLANDPAYPALFASAFPDQDLSIDTIAKAIATFERTLISGNSPYDQYVYQAKQDALSDSAKRGLELFFSERLECDHCHGGVNFSSATTHAGETFSSTPQFENNGLYNIDGKGAYPSENQGLITFTGIPSDMGKFKPPSLRNVAVSAPYMHDGSIGTLEGVLAHYSRGGRKIDSGPYAGDGSKNPYKSALIAGFNLTGQETQDVIEFLRSLTDQDYISQCDISDPFDAASPCNRQ